MGGKQIQASICHMRRRPGYLLINMDYPAFSQLNHPEILGILNLNHTHRIFTPTNQATNVLVVNNDIPVYYQEVAINQALDHFNRIRRTQLFPLGAIVDTYPPPLATTKIMAYLLIMIANNKDKFADTSLPRLDEQMLQDGLIGYR